MLVPGLSVRRSTLRLLLLVSFYSTFILLGAAIFSAIENPEEAERVNDLRKSRSEFLQRHPSVTGKFLVILLHFRTVDNALAVWGMRLIAFSGLKPQQDRDTFSSSTHCDKRSKRMVFLSR